MIKDRGEAEYGHNDTYDDDDCAIIKMRLKRKQMMAGFLKIIVNIILFIMIFVIMRLGRLFMIAMLMMIDVVTIIIVLSP